MEKLANEIINNIINGNRNIAKAQLLKLTVKEFAEVLNIVRETHPNTSNALLELVTS